MVNQEKGDASRWDAAEMISHSKPTIDGDSMAAVNTLLRAGMLARGDAFKQFDARLREHMNSENVFYASSGTHALFLILKALELSASDEVIVPTYVCEAVENAVRHAGAKVVFCDVGDDWLLNEASVDAVMTGNTKAIIPVHLFGRHVHVEHLLKFNVQIIEDFCQAFPRRMRNALHPAPHESSFSFYSFHATKCLTMGEGGVIRLPDKRINAKFKKNLAREAKLFILSDLQAALGLQQLSCYEKFLKRREDIATLYLGSIHSARVRLPNCLNGDHVWFRFPLKVNNLDFDLVAKSFAEYGIAVKRGVDRLLHRNHRLSDRMFPGAISVFNQTLSLPLYPSLSHANAMRIVKAVREVLS